MFLIERLIGVGVYCCVLAAVYLLLAASPMKCKTALGFYILVLSGMAVVYVPYRTADLYRIFKSRLWFFLWSYMDVRVGL